MKNRTRLLIAFLSLVSIITVFIPEIPVAAYPQPQGGRSYTYDESGNDVFIPDPYTYIQSVKLADNAGLAADNAQDFFIDHNKNIYVLDTNNNRILVYNSKFEWVKTLAEFKYQGETLTLNAPEGLYVSPGNKIIIADTQNGRILQCDQSGNVDLVIEKPANMTGIEDAMKFMPMKVAADSLGRIYVTAKNINFGIIRLDSKGIFMGYIGAPKVQADLYTLLLKKYFTKQQKKKLVEFVATEYNNIVMDSSDFLWGTISSIKKLDIKNAIESGDKSGNVTPIRKLNSMGNDILKRNGDYAPLGDLKISESESADVSRIVDVAINENGIYSMLDQTKGHIFTYNDNGNLLYIFGNIDFKKSDLQMPVAINYLDNKILVLDSVLSEIKVYEPTSYGKKILEAEKSQYNGDFEKAYGLWSEIAHENTNFKYAFVGLGNAKLKEKNYTEALKFFKYANDIPNYSKTFILIRKEQMKVYFPVIFISIISLIAIAILSSLLRKFVRYYRGI